MRVLFTTIPAYGHLTPMIPLARAAKSLGHAVAIATAESFRPVVDRAGFDLLSVGIDEPTAQARLVERHPEFRTLPREERSRRVVPDLFARIYAPSLVEDAERILEWKPDVIVREEGEFASPLIATVAGIPWVDHGWGPLRPRDQLEAAEVAIAPLWRSSGFEPPPLAGAYRWLYLDPCPPSMQSQEAEAIENRHLISPLQTGGHSADLPDWVNKLGRRPLVYVTLGTVPVVASDVDFFRIVLAALEGEDLDAVVTVGPKGDPAQLGVRHPNVFVERFVPQDAVLRHAALAITNGGSGSTLGSLAAAVPILVVPGPAPSQTRNAQAVLRARCGRTLDREALTAEAARREIRTLLDDDSYRRAATQVATEIVNMPRPDVAIGLIDRLVAEGYV